MTVTLSKSELQQTLEHAFRIATSKADLPQQWLARAQELAESPSVAFVAGVGSVLLAKATDPEIDAFVLKARAGGAGAFSLRSAATILANNRHAFGYDIGSTSDQDPINHSTLNGFTRWDAALDRITPPHKPFFQIVLRWLADINKMSQDDALLALAAYIRVRLTVSSASAVAQVPLTLTQAPPLTDLIDQLEAFVSSAAEGGARGMALVAAAYRAAGFEAGVPSRNDPRRIDIPIKRAGQLVIGSEVKQLQTSESTADTLATDIVAAGIERGLLAVLRPGHLDGFDRTSVIRRAERDHNIVIRITEGVRELLHEAITNGTASIEDFCSALPHHFAQTLDEIHVEKDTIETWAAIAQRWTTV